MRPGVALAIKPDIRIGDFLTISKELLGYSPANVADSMTIPLKPLAHLLVCLSSLKSEKDAPNLKKAPTELISLSFIVAADERDMLDIIEMAGNMPFIYTETSQRGIVLALISGTIESWRRAVIRACQYNVDSNTRYVFNQVYQIMAEQGLKEIFQGLHMKEQHDRTFLLEDKR